MNPRTLSASVDRLETGAADSLAGLRRRTGRPRAAFFMSNRSPSSGALMTRDGPCILARLDLRTRSIGTPAVTADGRSPAARRRHQVRSR